MKRGVLRGDLEEFEAMIRFMEEYCFYG